MPLPALLPLLKMVAPLVISKLAGGGKPKTINGLPAQSGLPGVSGKGGTDWLGLASAATGFLDGRSDDANTQAQLQLQRDQLAQSGTLTREQLAQNQRQYESTQKQSQGQQALSATQMDPLYQQRSRQKQALMEQLMKGASSPTLNVAEGRFDGGMKYGPEMFKQISSYFAPEARSAAESQFSGAANAASGGQYGTPNLAAMGYGASATPLPQAPQLPTTPLPQAPGIPGIPGVRKRPFDEDEDGLQMYGGRGVAY